MLHSVTLPHALFFYDCGSLFVWHCIVPGHFLDTYKQYCNMRAMCYEAAMLVVLDHP